MLIEVFLGALCALLAWNYFKKPKNYPPGYWGLPIIGYIPLSGTSVKEHVFALKKKYNSDVVSWKMGSQLMVYVLNYNLIKENLAKLEFADRPEFKMAKLCSEDWENFGLVMRNGPGWHNGRRFSLRLLKDLGMGKSKLVSVMQSEALELVNELKKVAGEPQPLPHSFVVAILNVLWQMIANKKFAFDNKELLEFDHLLSQLQKYAQYIAIQDFLPWITNVVPSFILGKVLKLKMYNEFRGKFKKFFIKQIKEHEDDLNPDDPRDYIDHYLIEMKKQESDVNSTMSMEDLITCCADLYNAGSETTKITFIWALFYLANNQDVQSRMQKEIDEVLPNGAVATMEDKGKLPYTEAVIHEVLRISSLVPLGVMRLATQDVEIGGYLVPKGSVLNPVFADCHFDPDVWESPMDFRPERFLNSEGKFVTPKEGFIPFGYGKRQCLGESLARMQIFIFLTTIVQNLAFSPPPGKSMDLNPLFGNPIANLPNEDQNILVTIR